MQSVSWDFGSELRIVNRRAKHRCHGVGALPGSALLIPAQHVHHEQVHESVAVDIGRVHGHRAEALVAEQGARCRLKTSPCAVEPDTVLPVHEIVAHVEIRPSVTIQVAEQGAQPPVGWRGFQFPPVLIQECALGPGNGGEVSAPLIEVEEISFSLLEDFGAAIPFADHQETVGWRHADAPIGLASGFDSQARRMVLEGCRPVVGDVQIEVAVSVDVGQGQRGGTQSLG